MILFFIVLLFLVPIYLYCTNNHDYWSKRNVKHDTPIPLFGNHLQNHLCLKSWVELSVELYNRYKDEKLIGYYKGRIPELIIKDLDLIKQIMTVDFLYFHHRGLGGNPKLESLFNNLFHADGDIWRLMRQRLTPAFTIAKLKAMFPLIVKCAERLQDTLGNGGEIDAREIMTRFGIEFIGASGFGIEMDTINNERSQFRELGRLITSRSLKSRIHIPLWNLFPELRSILHLLDPKIENAMTHIVERIREQRQYRPAGRNDFIDLLLELEAKGKLIGESVEKQNPDGAPMTVEMEMDLQNQVAQVFIFFVAGFETSSSATSFTLHELAYNPDVQERIQLEIDEVLSKYDNKLCYDAIAQMNLLDMAFKEGMRKFPSLGVLNRVCTRRYKVPGYDITIDPGVKIVIPVQAIQMDEKYFDNPEEFRPERFTPEESKKRHKFAYLPFGEGPRACIGERLGHMQSLAGLAAILHKFSVLPAPQSTRKIKINYSMNLVPVVQGGLHVVLEPRKKNQ